MSTQFPPSTFPIMSLGPSADLTSPTAANTNTQQQLNISPADIPSVLAELRACSSTEQIQRQPAEQQLQQWENALLDSSNNGGGTLVDIGYLSSLLTILNDFPIPPAHEGIEDNVRLMATILFKNAIPKVFSVDLSSDSASSSTPPEVLQRLQAERNHIREILLRLILSQRNSTMVLHLQLSMANIAIYDFPKYWPNMLEILAQATVDPSTTNEQRIRSIKTLRMCLQSIRQRKLIIPNKGSKKGGRGMLLMGNLGNMIGAAVSERKEMHAKASSIFEILSQGIVQHAQNAVSGGAVNANSTQEMIHETWQAESTLAVGFIKAMMELLPMVEIDNISTDPRSPAVRQLLSSLTQIASAIKAYPSTNIPQILSNIANIQQEYTIKMDKIYRATILCCICAIRSMPQLFASNVSSILQTVVEPILLLDTTVLQNMPVKRLMDMTGLIRIVLSCSMYDEKKKNSLLSGKNNAVLALLSGKGGGGEGDSGNNPNEDPGVVEAQATVTALLAEGTIERLCEALVGKFLRLNQEEIEEWEADPEGRYETDLSEKSLLEADSPRRCGGALLLTLMNRETDRVAKTLLNLTQQVLQQGGEDVNGMLNREACYRSLELCHNAMVGRGERRLNFSDWYQAELLPILQTDLDDNSPVAMKAMQARAVQVVQVYSTSLKTEEYGIAFNTVARLIAAKDLVTAFCAARCINQLALLHIKGETESAELVEVRSHSVFALGNAFTLANRAESEECLRVTLMCISAIVEANGLHLEPVLQAIAEQLPALWERAQDSVTIHSCLVSVLKHLIMKMGYSTIENPHVQKVLFPLLDYCTDISVPNRADNLLEDGLSLWLVVLVSSRVATMGPSLTSMLPRLADILRAGLEPYLSLKVLQYNALLLGQQVLEPHAETLRQLLINLTSFIYSEQEDDTMGNSDRSTGGDRGTTTIKNAIAALTFGYGIMQLYPDVSLGIVSPAVSKLIANLSSNRRKSAPVLEALFETFGRILWAAPTCLDEIFAGDPNQEKKIAGIVHLFLSVVTSVPVLAVISPKAQKIVFMNQKKAMLSLCSAVCRSPRVARVSGNEVLKFTRKLAEAEAKSGLDLDTLVEAACGKTRKVVGDGPLGDAAAKAAESLKSE